MIHGGTTILLPNESFGLAYFQYHPDFAKFYEGASRAVADALKEGGGLKLEKTDDDRLHFTTIPWVSFTSFSHARNWKRENRHKVASEDFRTVTIAPGCYLCLRSSRINGIPWQVSGADQDRCLS